MMMLTRTFDLLLWGLAMISAGLLAAIAVAIAANVALRSLGLPVLYGTLDAIEYALLIATFMGAPWVLALDAHVKVDLMTQSVGPRARRVLHVATNLVGAVSALVLAWFGAQAMLASIARGAMIRTSFTFPEWWTLTVVPLSMLLCAVIFLRKALRPGPAAPTLTGL
ncbi:TRAP transporter small permease [Sulfitobacter sabulilitoris]|uniref:TRAP transporter small permease protein n=1 Tax=Sulfitobacter sabulilitoris TaxID=2562655 RepID=A0A5S3QBB5_9RHOB|nr:TRAP transporter small permease [Sulfitobacter sabulilitoris]TMM54392.1 TRAP transporter small permease [Sulfitobacter sabulilitoris]